MTDVYSKSSGFFGDMGVGGFSRTVTGVDLVRVVSCEPGKTSVSSFTRNFSIFKIGS